MSKTIACVPERDAAYDAIDSERDYQDAGRGNARRHEGRPEMAPGEIILCMEKCLHDAREWVARKFNKTSEKVGLATRFVPSTKQE